MPVLRTLKFKEWDPIASEEGEGKHKSITWKEVLANDGFAKYLVIRGYKDSNNTDLSTSGFLRNPKGMAIVNSVIQIEKETEDGPY